MDQRLGDREEAEGCVACDGVIVQGRRVASAVEVVRQHRVELLQPLAEERFDGLADAAVELAPAAQQDGVVGRLLRQ